MNYEVLPEPVTVRDDSKRLTNKTRPKLEPIPEQGSGDFEIVHRTTWKTEGMKVLDGGKVRVPEGSTFTILRRKSTRTVWMSDTPMEVDSMKQAAKHAKGDVLVLGLGLAVFIRLATKAKSITVVEHSPDIAAMVWPHVKDDRMTLYMGDAKAALDEFAADGRTFDFIYADIWDSSDCEYLPHVNWYLDRSRALLNEGGEVMAWAYQKMLRSYVRQGTELALMARSGAFADERREGARKRWPALMVVIDYMLDAVENDEVPPMSKLGAYIEFIGRTIVTEPEYLEDLIDREVAKVDAAERGLPEPKPRVKADPPKGPSTPSLMGQMLGFGF